MQYQLSRIVAGPFLHTIWRPKVTGAEHVPAAVLPFALPLGIAIAATAAYHDYRARYRETTAPSASPVTRK